MLDRVITVAMTISSLLVLCFWFRYTCSLILKTATSQEDAGEKVAQAYHLGYPEAHERLSNGATELDRLANELDRLHEMLDRDYATLTALMNQAKGTQDGIERRMLSLHYTMMAASYRLSRRISPAASLKALEEMSTVVAYFANSMGEGAESPA